MDVGHCILGESARTLLFVLLDELKRKDNGRRDEVLIPGYTCYSVAAAVAKANLKISVYDLDPKTFCADIDSLEKAISEKTLAVVTQHLFGILTPIDKLKIITDQNGAYLIEDSAQALGRVEKCSGINRTLGDFVLFSFGRGKPLPIGGGGALVSRSHSEIINKMTFKQQKKGHRYALLSAVTKIVSKPALYWIPEMLPLGTRRNSIRR